MQAKKILKSEKFAEKYFFICSQLADGRRAQPADSHNRLFGDTERPYTPAKNRLRSNIPIGGGDEADASLKHSNANGHTTSSREHINGSENGKSNYQKLKLLRTIFI